MLKNILSVFSTNVFAIVVSVINSILLSRFFGSEYRGSYILILSVLMIFGNVFSLGIGPSIIFYSAKNRYIGSIATYSSLLLFVIVVTLFTTLLIASTSFLSSLLNFFPKNIEANLMISVSILCILFLLIHGSLSAYYTGIKNFKKINQSKIISQITLLFNMILLYFLIGKQSVKIDLLVLVVILLPFIFQIFPFLSFFKENKPLISSKVLINTIKWGVIPYFAGIFQFLNYRLDYWFIEYYHDIDMLGEYSLSSSLSQMLWILPIAIGTVLFPSIINIKKTEKKKKVKKILKYVSGISIFIGIFSFLLAKPLFPIIYGDEFINSSHYFKILLLGSVPYSLATIIASYFLSSNIAKINLYASFFGFLLSLVLDIIFIPTYGAIGAAWTTSISLVSTTIIVFVIYFKH